MATKDTGAPLRDRALRARLFAWGGIVGSGAVVAAAGAGGLRGALLSAAGPAVATALVAAARHLPARAIAIGASFSGLAGLFLHWAIFASPGMGYPELRIFRDGPWFSALLTIALGLVALKDQQRRVAS